MKVLDHLPYFEEPSFLSFRGITVEIRAYQIALWVRLQRLAFPAILDTGHSHNFSIPERLLRSWADVDTLDPIGEIVVNRLSLTQYKSDFWIHCNRRGQSGPTDEAVSLNLRKG